MIQYITQVFAMEKREVNNKVIWLYLYSNLVPPDGQVLIDNIPCLQKRTDTYFQTVRIYEYLTGNVGGVLVQNPT